MQLSQILRSKGDRIITIGPDASIAQVAEVLRQEKIGAVVVTDGAEKVVGIISERDLVRGIPQHGAKLLDMKVSEIMTASVVTCSADRTVDHVMREMTAGRFRHLPVVENGRLLGVISIGDVVKNRLEELESETDALREYIVGQG